jgi:mRNA-degrading endonuclease RelE of RelBE toxin-antitoxin system
MAWKIKITKAARKIIQEVKEWYRSQSFQALKEFTDELTAAIETLKEDIIDYRTADKTTENAP